MLHKVYNGSECREFTDEESYREYCSQFKEVNAAGGLVRDSSGNYLMIFRNGVWDLPKGHQEPGEDIRDTASREVWEETAVGPLPAGELVCITDHCYFRNEIWHLKHTWWFEMTLGSGTETAPQTEEGITEVEWVAEDDLPSHLDNTYPSIAEVFEEYKKKKI